MIASVLWKSWRFSKTEVSKKLQVSFIYIFFNLCIQDLPLHLAENFIDKIPESMYYEMECNSKF